MTTIALFFFGFMEGILGILKGNWPTANTVWDFPQFQDIITCFLFGYAFGYAFVEGHLLHYRGA
jgi:hypothetical protein